MKRRSKPTISEVKRAKQTKPICSKDLAKWQQLLRDFVVERVNATDDVIDVFKHMLASYRQQTANDYPKSDLLHKEPRTDALKLQNCYDSVSLVKEIEALLDKHELSLDSSLFNLLAAFFSYYEPLGLAFPKIKKQILIPIKSYQDALEKRLIDKGLDEFITKLAIDDVDVVLQALDDLSNFMHVLPVKRYEEVVRRLLDICDKSQDFYDKGNIASDFHLLPPDMIAKLPIHKNRVLFDLIVEYFSKALGETSSPFRDAVTEVLRLIAAKLPIDFLQIIIPKILEMIGQIEEKGDDGYEINEKLYQTLRNMAVNLSPDLIDFVSKVLIEKFNAQFAPILLEGNAEIDEAKIYRNNIHMFWTLLSFAPKIPEELMKPLFDNLMEAILVALEIEKHRYGKAKTFLTRSEVFVPLSFLFEKSSEEYKKRLMIFLFQRENSNFLSALLNNFSEQRHLIPGLRKKIICALEPVIYRLLTNIEIDNEKQLSCLAEMRIACRYLERFLETEEIRDKIESLFSSIKKEQKMYSALFLVELISWLPVNEYEPVYNRFIDDIIPFLRQAGFPMLTSIEARIIILFPDFQKDKISDYLNEINKTASAYSTLVEMFSSSSLPKLTESDIHILLDCLQGQNLELSKQAINLLEILAKKGSLVGFEKPIALHLSNYYEKESKSLQNRVTDGPFYANILLRESQYLLEILIKHNVSLYTESELFKYIFENLERWPTEKILSLSFKMNDMGQREQFIAIALQHFKCLQEKTIEESFEEPLEESLESRPYYQNFIELSPVIIAVLKTMPLTFQLDTYIKLVATFGSPYDLLEKLSTERSSYLIEIVEILQKIRAVMEINQNLEKIFSTELVQHIQSFGT